MVLFLCGLALCALGIVVAVVAPRPTRVPITMLAVAAGCALAFAAGLGVAVGHHATSLHVSSLLPLTGADLSLDPLGAIFVMISAGVGFAASVYAVGYADAALRSRAATSLFALFVLSLLAVPVAAGVVTFLFAWELMALSSLLLILVDHQHRAAARSAALWYGATTQGGAAAILLGLVLVSAHSGQGFGAVAAHAAHLSPVVRSAGFLLTLVGFAAKAGAVPFHVWLPRAHPEAPSHVSALMSGAMVATGVYGILRVGVLLHGGPSWWWIIVVVLGVLSSLFGALHTTTSADLKRLLAYSTIDVMGLVLIGVGAAGVLSATGQGGVARLTLVAALLLVCAHAAFKACLFLAAGSVERATGLRDLDSLGGLVRTLPVTAAAFGLSALAIMAVPTLSGFSGEWLLLEGLIHGFASRDSGTLIALLLSVAAIALTAGLTVVAFVKAFGIGFLGQARTPGAASARQSVGFMEVALVMLCVPSVALGVVPGTIVPALSRAAGVALGGHSPVPLTRESGLVLRGLRGAVEPALLVGALVTTVVVIWALSRLVARRGARRVAPWSTGREFQTARMQYTATSFGEPLQRVFADVLRPDVDIEVTHVAESKYYEQALVYQARVDDAVERALYRPVIRTARGVGVAARALANGSVHRYLALGLIALLVVLVVLA